MATEQKLVLRNKITGRFATVSDLDVDCEIPGIAMFDNTGNGVRELLDAATAVFDDEMDWQVVVVEQLAINRVKGTLTNMLRHYSDVPYTDEELQ